MRIAFILVLLMTAVARPAWSQDAQAQSTLPGVPALPASLTPVDAPASADPISLDLRRNHGLGVMIGAGIGAVAGTLVGNRIACTETSGEGNAQGICKLAVLGLGVAVGALMGGLIGVPVKDSGR